MQTAERATHLGAVRGRRLICRELIGANAPQQFAAYKVSCASDAISRPAFIDSALRRDDFEFDRARRFLCFSPLFK
jgi:hypothetical protein